VFDPLPLIVTQSVPPHQSAPNKLTAYESKKPPRRNRLRIIQRRLSAQCGNRDSLAQHGGQVAPPAAKPRALIRWSIQGVLQKRTERSSKYELMDRERKLRRR
jgi:hypothetical protein